MQYFLAITIKYRFCPYYKTWMPLILKGQLKENRGHYKLVSLLLLVFYCLNLDSRREALSVEYLLCVIWVALLMYRIMRSAWFAKLCYLYVCYLIFVWHLLFQDTTDLQRSKIYVALMERFGNGFWLRVKNYWFVTKTLSDPETNPKKQITSNANGLLTLRSANSTEVTTLAQGHKAKNESSKPNDPPLKSSGGQI